MLLATYDLLKRNPNPSEAEIREGITGNLCMCTGYVNIVKAVKAAAEKMAPIPKMRPGEPAPKSGKRKNA